jgi:hypothetical protein
VERKEKEKEKYGEKRTYFSSPFRERERERITRTKKEEGKEREKKRETRAKKGPEELKKRR